MSGAGELQPETRGGTDTQNVPLLLSALAGFKQHRSLMKQRDRPGLLKLKNCYYWWHQLDLIYFHCGEKAVLEQHTNAQLCWFNWKYLSLAFPTRESFLKMRALRS